MARHLKPYPENVSRAGWYFKLKTIERAAKALGIELPIKIRYTAGQFRVGIMKIGRDEQGNLFHRVTVCQDKSVEEASRILWHELKHAAQAQAWANETGEPITLWYRTAYMMAKGERGKSYEDNAYEIEADSYARKQVERGRLLVEPYEEGKTVNT